MLVAHNARFDVGFLQRALGAIDGRRLELPVLDTVSLARRLLCRPRGALRPRHARRSLLAPDAALPPCASRRPGDRRAAAAPDRVRAGARGAHRRGRARPRRVGAAGRAGPQAPRRAGAGRAGRVHPARRARAGDVRRQGGRSPLPGALVLRLAPAEAGARGGARSARPRRLRAARQRARGRARRARADPRVAASGECPEHPSRARAVPAARRRGSRADARVARRSEERWRPVRRPVGVSSHGGDRARGLARRVRAAHLPPEGADRGGHVPAGPARTLRRALSRQRRERGLRGRHRAGSGATSRGAARAGRVEVRARLAKLVAERRFEEASRRVGDLAALDRVDAALAALRRSRARSGLLLASDIDPGLVRCLAVRGGRALGWRSLPRRGDPSSAIGSVLHELTRPPAGPGDGPAGPWLPADEAEAAALLAAAFAGRAPGVVPIATTLPDGRARDAAADRRWAGARPRARAGSARGSA